MTHKNKRPVSRRASLKRTIKDERVISWILASKRLRRFSIMFNNNHFNLLIFCAVFSSSAVIGNAQQFWAQGRDDTNAKCQTPHGIEGTCINVKQCKPMLEYLQLQTTGISTETTELLRNYKCGVDKNTVLICCPSTPELLVETPPDVDGHRNLGRLPKNCGNMDTGDRIINGETAGLFEFPFMALLSYATPIGKQFLCGGTIINEKYILTAAHCLTGLKYPLLGVRVGEYNVSSAEDCEYYDGKPVFCAPPYKDLFIEEVTVHPQYNIIPSRNDIGLIRISGVMNTSQEHIKPICLPLEKARDFDFDERNLTVTGWGATEKGQASPVLLKANVPFIPYEECRNTYQELSEIAVSRKQMCAGGINKSDSCRGDSGGPLINSVYLHNDNRFVQHGIVSTGPKDCGKKNRPAVYTRVDFYMDWILDNIKP